MTRYSELLAQQQRRVMLEALAGADGGRANDAVLRIAIEAAIGVTTREQVRAHLQFLERANLVLTEQLTDSGHDLRIVQLTDQGSAVARGLAHDGVADRLLP